MNLKQLIKCAKEFIWKEPLSCLLHGYYRLKNIPSPYIGEKTRVGKALLLLHGSGAKPSSLIPLFHALGKECSVCLIDLSKEKEAIPTKPIHEAMGRIRREFLKKGFQEVEFSFVGHSLGAIAAAKAIWVEGCSRFGKVHALTSLAGRLKFVSGPFDWFCEELVPEIQKIHSAITKKPELATLYTIAGELDELVPLSSVHIAEENLTVKGVGHGGLPFAEEAHAQILKWLSPWMFERA